MPDYCILTGSTADFPNAAFTKDEITVLPYPYYVGGREYTQDLNQAFDFHTFYDSMRGGALPTTSNLNQMTIGSAVQQCFEQGRDALYVVFSSGLSSTYQVAVSTQQMLMEQYPQRRLVLVDSLSASLGQGILAQLAVRYRSEGLSLEETMQKLLEARLRIQHFITVSDLDHLFRGGRISRAAAMVGRLASVKPILIVNREGRMAQIEKVNGRRKSIRTLVEHVKQTPPDYARFDTAYVLHGDCQEDAEKLREKVMEETNFKKVEIHPLGPVIGAHTGPDMLAVTYLSKKERTT